MPHGAASAPLPIPVINSAMSFSTTTHAIASASLRTPSAAVPVKCPQAVIVPRCCWEKNDPTNALCMVKAATPNHRLARACSPMRARVISGGVVGCALELFRKYWFIRLTSQSKIYCISYVELTILTCIN